MTRADCLTPSRRASAGIRSTRSRSSRRRRDRSGPTTLDLVTARSRRRGRGARHGQDRQEDAVPPRGGARARGSLSADRSRCTTARASRSTPPRSHCSRRSPSASPARSTAPSSLPPFVTLTAGAPADLAVRVANLGTAPWGSPAIPGTRGRRDGVAAVSATLVAHWVHLGIADPADEPAADLRADMPPGLAAGAVADVALGLWHANVPGDYLLVLDVVIPDHGSLTALGVPPTIVRVQVAEPVSVAGPESTPGEPGVD